MKYITLLLLLFTLNCITAQHNPDTPWMKDLQKKSTKKAFTLKEISKVFNDYWNIHKADKDKKGSGFKPFKRWENRWNLSLDKQGKIISNNKIWEAWEEKNTLSRNSLNDISNWENVGPYTQESKSGQGRVNTFIVDPNNPNTYYIGAPAGGIWKSLDAGTTWTPLTDHLPQIGVSGIAIDPNNSNVIYIATGDDDAYDTYSVGVYKSTDGGSTWSPTGLQFVNSGKFSNEIYINPNNSNMLWVATSDGLYKTIDAGVNWNLTFNQSLEDLKLKPNDPSVVYITTSNSFYKSTDFGETFSQISFGLPSQSNKLIMDVTPANDNVVYVLSTNGSNNFQGVYKSSNSGTTFSQTLETNDIFGGSNQAWYDLALTVSDTDENTVFVGVLDIWKSTNGGDHFSQINQWFDSSSSTYTHADIHFLRYFNGDLFCGSDGGIYKSSNNGNSFNELNEGLSISLFYRIANASQSANNIVGGLQDNGGFAYSNNTWYNYHGGDGMDCAVDPNNPNTYYGFTQYGGSLNVTYNGGISGQGVTGAPENGNWITPMKMNSQGELYAGFSKLYVLVNNQWQVVSGDVFSGRLHRIEIDPNNSNTIFVARYNDLYKSTDKGINFTKVYTTTDNISSIEINNNNGNIIYLTTSSGEDGQVLKSIDAGSSFNNITNNLPSESKLIIKHQPHSPFNDLFVGSSLGVYHINDNMSSWETYSNGLPNVPVRDLEINVNDHKIIAGTYGRSVWQSDIEVIPPTDDIRLISINNPNSNVQCSNSITPTILVKNQGANSINQVTINYAIDGNNSTYNYNGTINSQETANIDLPAINGLNMGEHTIQVNTTINNDAYSENNNSNATFYINQTDNDPTIVNPFNFGFFDKWLITGNQNVWQIGQPSTTILGASNNKGYTTLLNSNYPDNTSSYLTSPCYDLTTITNPVMKFNMTFDLEEDWDVLYVEYSTNQGQTWSVLGTANDANWYNSTYDQHQLTIGNQWTGTDTTLKEYSHDLAALNNENSIIFRFAFLSDQAVNQEGVFIDNFVIEGQVASVDEEIFNAIKVIPNPSNGTFSITKSNFEPINITIYDVTGKKVFSASEIKSKNKLIDLNEVNKGVYFINITSINNNVIKKIIIK